MEGSDVPISGKQKTIRFFKRKTVWVTLLIVIAVGYFLFRPKPVSYMTVTVQRQDIVQEVTATGSTKPAQTLDLSFERGGTVSSVPTKVGDVVLAGQALVRLDATADRIDLAQKEAALASAQATLKNLETPAQPADIAVLQSKLSGASSDFAAAKQKLVDTLQSSYTAADDAIRNYADQFFDNADSSSPRINITVNDTQLKLDLNSEREQTEGTLDSWQIAAAALTTDSDLAAAVASTRTDLESVRTLLNDLSLAVNALVPNQSLSATTISTYRSNVATARSEVNTALSSLTTSEDSFLSAAAALDLAQKNLDQTLAGTAPEQIAAQKAQVQVAQANVDSARHQLYLSVLRSPISGVVTKQDAKIGQVVTANAPVTSVITEGPLQIEAYIPEVDIGRMGIGASTTVTFDAFPSETFTGTVAYIDPGETVLEGVPTYKVTLALSLDDSRIRPGMTANLTVIIAEHYNVLAIPYRAVQSSTTSTSTQQSITLLLPDKTTREVPVKTGIRGISGNVEILAGLAEGDTVVIPSR